MGGALARLVPACLRGESEKAKALADGGKTGAKYEKADLDGSTASPVADYDEDEDSGVRADSEGEPDAKGPALKEVCSP